MIEVNNKTSIDFSNIFSIASSVSSDDQFDTVSILSRYSPLSDRNPRVRNFDYVNTGVTYEYCTRDRTGAPISFSLDTVTGARQSRAHTDRYYWTGDVKRDKETKRCFFTWSEIDGAEFIDESVDKNQTYKTDGILILPTPGWVYPWGYRFLSFGHSWEHIDTVGYRITNTSFESAYFSPGMYQTWNHKASVGDRRFWADGAGLACYSSFNPNSARSPNYRYKIMPGTGLPQMSTDWRFLSNPRDFVGVDNSATLQHAFKIELNFENLPPYTWVPLFGFGINRIGNAANLSDSLGEKMYTTNKDGAGTSPKRDGNRVPPAFTHNRNNLYRENTIGNERGLAYCWYKYNDPEKIGTDEYYDHISEPVRCNQADSNLLQYWIYSHDGAGNAMVATCAGELPMQYDYAGRCPEYPRNKMWGKVNGLSQWVAPIALTSNRHFAGESGEPSLIKLWRQFGGDGVPREDGKPIDNYYTSFRIWHKYHRSDSFAWNIIENCPSLMDTVGYAAVTSDIFVGFEWVADRDSYVRDPKLEELPPYAYLDQHLGIRWSPSYYGGKPWPGAEHILQKPIAWNLFYQNGYGRRTVFGDSKVQFAWESWQGNAGGVSNGWACYFVDDNYKNLNYIPNYNFISDASKGTMNPQWFGYVNGDSVEYQLGKPKSASDGIYLGCDPTDGVPFNDISLNYPDPDPRYCYLQGPSNIKSVLYSSAFHADPRHADDKKSTIPWSGSNDWNLRGPAHPKYTESWCDKTGLVAYNIGQLISYGPTSNADLKNNTEIHINISMVQDDNPVNLARTNSVYYNSNGYTMPWTTANEEWPQVATSAPSAAVRAGKVRKHNVGSGAGQYRLRSTYHAAPSPTFHRGVRRWLESGYSFVATGRIGDFTFRDVPMITSHECHRGTMGGTPVMPALMIRASVVGDCRIHNVEYASYPYTGTRRTITDPEFLSGQISSGYDTDLQFFIGGFTWGPVELAKDDASRIRNIQDQFPNPEQWINPIGLLDGDITNRATIKGVGEENALYIKMNGPLTVAKPADDAPLSKLNVLLREVRQLSLLSYRLTLAIVSEDKQTTLWELPFENSVAVEVNNSVSFPPAGGAINFDINLGETGLLYSQIKNAWMKVWAIRNA